nr:reverse transcriptase domain-containing protein [Tanacetum cinerariifolium]
MNNNNDNNANNRNGRNNRCSYKTFLACNPRDYDGKGGAVVLTRWIEKTESVMDNSGCADNQKVKYAKSSFINKGLTWWNTYVQARGRKAVLEMTWVELKALLVEEFYPSNEMEKMLRATQPTTIHSVILNAWILTDEAIRCGTLTKSSKKKKEVEESSKQGDSWKDNKKEKVGKGFVATNPPRNENVGSYPKRAKCSTYHPESGPCSIVSPGYVIEVANGKKEEVDRIIRDCKLELGNSLFTIDLIPLGHGSFDVIVRMDWLSKNKVEIVCHEKVVRIPFEGGEILRVQRERTFGGTRTLMSTKADEPKLSDIPIVRDFTDVF